MSINVKTAFTKFYNKITNNGETSVAFYKVTHDKKNIYIESSVGYFTLAY